MRGLTKLLCFIFIIGSADQIFGRNSVNHTISIQVVYTNTLTTGQNNERKSMIESDHERNINMETGDPSRRLWWKTDHCEKKITVAARKLSEKTKLEVEAIRCVDGEIVGKVLIDAHDHDFMNSILNSDGSCDLIYSVLNQDIWSEKQGIQEVVYTITDVH
jgi:hypothetical protein